MSNRATRRADLADFRRDAHKAHLVTFLVDAADDASLGRLPLLSRALAYWRGNVMQRRPFCPACKANYADGALPGAFLFATVAVAPTNASVTAFCTECWRDLPPEVIERESARVLRSIVPSGNFIDHRDARR